MLIQNCRPVSSRKRFAIVDVLKTHEEDSERLKAVNEVFKGVPSGGIKMEQLSFKAPRPVDHPRFELASKRRF